MRLLLRLMRRYPAAFCLPPKPLALGIHRGISTADPGLLGEALRQWTSRPEYHVAIMHGGHRVDLNGQPAGLVSPADMNRAQWRLDRYHQRRSTRRLLQLGCDHFLNTTAPASAALVRKPARSGCPQ
jgi:sRNA-binding protein